MQNLTWVNSFQGNAIIVNGKAWPNMNVDRAQYRFRLLNGSNSRFINLNLSNGMSFVQIGSDGGYLKNLSNSDQEKQTLGQIMQFTVTQSQGPAPFNIT